MTKSSRCWNIPVVIRDACGPIKLYWFMEVRFPLRLAAFCRLWGSIDRYIEK